MASGAPVITSNVSSLPEVVADAALLVNPYDLEEIADAMRRVLSDETLRQQLKERGRLRARHFSWDRSVQRVREIYQEVLSR
jgi:glycosyltransferase involved in cell wall biosynthesis